MQLIDAYSLDEAPEILYEINKERQAEIGNQISFQMPTWEEHIDFISQRPYATWKLIYEDGYHGSITSTYRNEIGIVLFKASRGNGLAEQALKLFIDTHTPLPAVRSRRRSGWLANISPGNMASQGLFKKFGFKHISNTYHLDL